MSYSFMKDENVSLHFEKEDNFDVTFIVSYFIGNTRKIRIVRIGLIPFLDTMLDGQILPVV